MSSKLIADRGFTAFQGNRQVATGPLAEVIREAKSAFSENGKPVIVLDDSTSHPVEIDFRGPLEDILRRLAQPEDPGTGQPRHRGRPKLGVVAREITLLPRHWEWLNGQPGGASVALRKLVETALRDPDGKDRVRRAQEACYRFMSHLTGDEPGFEEATRSLYRGDRGEFERLIEPWPADFAAHIRRLAEPAFADA